MAASTRLKGRESAFSAAARRFPQSEFLILRLMDRSEAFCDMCEELAEAEDALSKVYTVAVELRETMGAEWQELISRLTEEVGTALQDKEGLVKPRPNG
ncbi:hypothetical protein LRP31_09025 [Mesorhizobium mediterraneum]|uniref:Uncharacterized protein n=1 Tax=Mesorhizobium mediterraneum TaxID=43617 RepID=A0AB36R3C5_9HYPH|nr:MULTISPECIES: hypothetical protein [Mesorhizobium]PAP99109.1 hypothetical protein CIT25_27925 [Mesorhizobium mediterraneum]RUU98079.1 hypothetical protein EOB36_24950 [Mesorhizobium sp. M6A.T.Cr.TU.017.01.1.1]RWN30518.1 MAG: hypothetical protein EOR96_30835 [Mesorhizobium sp.]RWQ62138.1 MAG: hypothetical protein EOS86_31435 [Mesorhizobium sp.]WIW55355.1 hypothetical protein LRP31_09025 [Mesorhizobium mediterraneum]